MKKLLILVLSLIFITGFTMISNAASSISERPDIKVIMEGELTSTATPIIISGRTLLPLRDLLVSLGVPNDDQHILWNRSEQSVTVNKDSLNLYLKVGATNAEINGQLFTIDAAPVNYQGSVYIPARFVAEAFSKAVFWDSDWNIIYIRDKAEFDEMKGILDKAQNMFDDMNYYKANIILENAIDDVDGASQKNTQSEQFSKSNNNSYSRSVSSINIDEQYLEEKYQCNNQFVYSSNSFSPDWEKAILSANYNAYLNSNHPKNIFPKSDSFYASLIMEVDQQNHLIHFKQDPYLLIVLNGVTFQSAVNRPCYSYDITIDSQSGYITKIKEKTKGNADNIMLIYQSITRNYYDFNKSFNIDLPNEITLDLQKTIIPEKLAIINDERKTIENLKISAIYKTIDFNDGGIRLPDKNVGILLCTFKDQASLDIYNRLSENAKIIFCNDSANEYREAFSLCDGVHVIVGYNGLEYTNVVTGYDFLLENIKELNGVQTDTIIEFIKDGDY